MKARIALIAAAGLLPLMASCTAKTPAPLESPVVFARSEPLMETASASPRVPATPPQLKATPTIQLAPSATPALAPLLRQLTSDGCCAQPFWSPDGERILFIDRPAPDMSSGIWGVRFAGGAPELVTEHLGIFSADMQLRAFPQRGQTVVERLESGQPIEGQRWVIPSSGRAVSFSPDGHRVAWTGGQSGPPFDTALREIWVSRVDGSQPRLVFQRKNGGLAGWFPDGRLLVSGRLEAPEEGQAYWVLPLDETSGSEANLTELARGSRLRGASISPDGAWLAYIVTSSEDPAQDGLWVVNTRSGQQRRLDLFGSYRWMDGDSLLVVPLDLSQPLHQLWQVEAASGQSFPLTDPAVAPFKIANGDWSVSPDGRQIAFISAADHNIWLLILPEE